jgi:hypothetical protein
MSTVKVNTISTWTGSDISIETGKTVSGTASQFKMTDVVQGDVLYGSAADTLSRLAPGTSGQFLQTAGAAANPAWATVTAATLAPAFSACTNTATTAFSSGTNQKVVLDRELFDSNGAFDSSTNYRFTVPAGEGGKYLISAGITFLWGSGAFNIQSMIFKNGAEAGSSAFVAGASWTTNQTLCGAWMLDLIATDYMELFGYITGGGTLQYNGNATAQRTWMSGFKLLGI